MSINESIDKYYRVTNEVLGSGYFAVVKVGYNNVTGEKVAVKCVDKNKVEREETLQNEIDILSSIAHDGVVRMLNIFDTEEILFIVMELMEGGELYEEIMKRSLFSEKEASRIIKQVLDALVYLHAKNVVHRDLKLENLLLKKKVVGDSPMQVKIADFGLSKLYSGKMHTACGTPFYVAPDILMASDDDDAGYGPPVDMWAVGILTYILLSGRLPFSGDEDEELFRNILEAKIIWKSPQFDTVSKSAKDFISHLIVLNPVDRFTAKSALLHPWITDNDFTQPLHKTFSGNLAQTKAQSSARVNKAKETKK
jgi:calcium/calmodulin-dependent protein kinase I